MKVKDINIDESVVYLRVTKNRKQQVIPLSNKLNKILNQKKTIKKQIKTF